MRRLLWTKGRRFGMVSCQIAICNQWRCYGEVSTAARTTTTSLISSLRSLSLPEVKAYHILKQLASLDTSPIATETLLEPHTHTLLSLLQKTRSSEPFVPITAYGESPRVVALLCRIAANLALLGKPEIRISLRQGGLIEASAHCLLKSTQLKLNQTPRDNVHQQCTTMTVKDDMTSHITEIGPKPYLTLQEEAWVCKALQNILVLDSLGAEEDSSDQTAVERAMACDLGSSLESLLRFHIHEPVPMVATNTDAMSMTTQQAIQWRLSVWDASLAILNALLIHVIHHQSALPAKEDDAILLPSSIPSTFAQTHHLVHQSLYRIVQYAKGNDTLPEELLGILHKALHLLTVSMEQSEGLWELERSHFSTKQGVEVLDVVTREVLRHLSTGSDKHTISDQLVQHDSEHIQSCIHQSLHLLLQLLSQETFHAMNRSQQKKQLETIVDPPAELVGAASLPESVSRLMALGFYRRLHHPKILPFPQQQQSLLFILNALLVSSPHILLVQPHVLPCCIFLLSQQSLMDDEQSLLLQFIWNALNYQEALEQLAQDSLGIQLENALNKLETKLDMETEAKELEQVKQLKEKWNELMNNR